MKTRLFLFLSVLFFFTSIHAQFQKGTMLSSGNVSFTNSKFSGTEFSSNSIVTNIEFGKFVSKKWLIGGFINHRLLLTGPDLFSNNLRSSFFELGILSRYYTKKNFFVEPNLVIRDREMTNCCINEKLAFDANFTIGHNLFLGDNVVLENALTSVIYEGDQQTTFKNFIISSGIRFFLNTENRTPLFDNLETHFLRKGNTNWAQNLSEIQFRLGNEAIAINLNPRFTTFLTDYIYWKVSPRFYFAKPDFVDAINTLQVGLGSQIGSFIKLKNGFYVEPAFGLNYLRRTYSGDEVLSNSTFNSQLLLNYFTKRVRFHIGPQFRANKQQRKSTATNLFGQNIDNPNPTYYTDFSIKGGIDYFLTNELYFSLCYIYDTDSDEFLLFEGTDFRTNAFNFGFGYFFNKNKTVVE